MIIIRAKYKEIIYLSFFNISRLFIIKIMNDNNTKNTKMTDITNPIIFIVSLYSITENAKSAYIQI